MKRLSFLAAVILLSLLTSPAFSNDKLRVGVVEFVEKNNIGLENSGKIIPEILVTHLKNIGVYSLSERILLKKALQEQEFQMTGIVSGETAVKLGKIYGLKAIITGTAVKIGNKTTISGRIINAENADIISSGTVTFNNIEDLESNLEQLAFLLSGYSKDAYNKVQFEKKLIRSRYGVRLGLGYGFSHTDDKDSSSAKEYMLGLYFHSRYFDGEVLASPPPADISGVTGYVSVNPFVHFGFAVGLSYFSDSINKNNNAGSSPDDFSIQADTVSLLYGITYRATSKIRASILLGYVLSGTYECYKDGHNYNYEAKKEFKFPGSSYLISLEYFFNESFSVMFTILGGGATGEPDAQTSTYTQEDFYIESQVFYLSCSYGFSL